MPEAAVDEELQAHFHAYLQIFRSVLNKRGIDPSRQKEILHKLRQFLLANVKSDDEFLDHIPEYASALGVKAEQLSAFIGQNLLKALESVRHQLEQQKVTAAREAVSRAETTGSPADDKAAQSIIEEILRATGVVVPAPAHFENHDLGFMKYIDENGGEHISGAFGEQSGGAPIAAPAKAGPSAGNGKTVTGQSVTGGGGVDKAAAKASAPVVSAKERPVIEEILEVLGDDHEIPGKLEPAEFPPEMSAMAAAAAPASGNAPGGAATAAPGASSAAPSSGNAASAAARPAAAPIVFPDEKEHLIAEIITKFGDSLSIPGKLEPDDGMGDSSGEYAPAPGSQSASMGSAGAGSGNAASAPRKVEVPPIPYHFQQYSEIARALQTFQQKGDRQGYQQWLNQKAGIPGRLMVGLRGLEGKQKRGQKIDWMDEYYNLSVTLDVEEKQVSDFHKRMRRFDRVQNIMNQFIARVKSGDAATMQAMKTIWPQVRLLFNNEGDDVAAMQSRLKIPLLQIADPAMKKRLMAIMEPLFRKVEEIWRS